MTTVTRGPAKLCISRQLVRYRPKDLGGLTPVAFVTMRGIRNDS